MSARVAALLLATLVIAAGRIEAGFPGPDVIYSDCTSIVGWGPIGGVRAYSLETITCNIGDVDLLWGSTHDGTPVLGMNAYRLDGGRLEQIGMSWAKHGASAGAAEGCGLPCNGHAGTVLGAGCQDVYSASYSGIQGILGPRSDVNAWTGEMLPPFFGQVSEIDRRLQIAESDLDVATYPDALYFVEGVYVGIDDAGALGNADNNASYKRVVRSGFNLLPTGSMQAGVPAIFAWRDHGGGVGIPDDSVEITPVDVPDEGRYYVAAKTVDLGGGLWQYEYAIFNLCSHRSARSFTVPLGRDVAVTAAGFHDVDYHSGERYDGTDWAAEVAADAVTWSSPQSYAENPDSNALRWGTLDNFWFTADTAPGPGVAQIGLFRPGDPPSVPVGVPAPGAICLADFDRSGDVGFADVITLLAAWGPCTGCPADLDGSGAVGFADLLLLLAGWGPCS